MRPMDRATADSLSVQSFAIIKNTGQENFVSDRFQTRARIGLSVWYWPVHSHPLPHRRSAAVQRLSETNNPSSNCPSKLTDKVRRIVHSKLKPFPFWNEDITYLTRIIRRIIISVVNDVPPPLSWASACLLLLFTNIEIFCVKYY